jgi:hypothetical protein
MRSSISVFAGILMAVALAAYNAEAQDLIYTLVSPNPEEGGWFGFSVSCVGDVNGDGSDDYAVGAHLEGLSTSGMECGKAYVFSGATGDMLRILCSPHEEGGGQFGYDVSGAGDSNGDGYADILVGAPVEAPGTSPSSAGRAYIFSGWTGDILQTLKSPNEEANGVFGASVASVGDVDADGYVDVVVGAPWESPGGVAEAGRAYIFSGHTSGGVSAQTGAVIHTLVSPCPSDEGWFGFGVSGVGDVNDDGHADVVVGADCEEPTPSPTSVGRSYVFSGATGDTLYSLLPPQQESSGHFGFAATGLADIDSDGYPDLAVGGHGIGGQNPQFAGMVYVYSGNTGALIYSLSPIHPDFEGSFGWALHSAVSQDGCCYLMVGSDEHPGGSPTNAGRAYVFDSTTGELFAEYSSPNEEYGGYFGTGLSGTGDIDGDGQPKLLVGAPGEDGAASDAGRVYLFTIPDTSVAADGFVTKPVALALEGPFPNPTAGPVRLGVRLLADSPMPAVLSLYEASGRRIEMIMEQRLLGEDDVIITWSPTSEISSGIYYWCLRAGDRTVKRQMVILK